MGRQSIVGAGQLGVQLEHTLDAGADLGYGQVGEVGTSPVPFGHGAYVRRGGAEIGRAGMVVAITPIQLGGNLLAQIDVHRRLGIVGRASVEGGDAMQKTVECLGLAFEKVRQLGGRDVNAATLAQVGYGVQQPVLAYQQETAYQSSSSTLNTRATVGPWMPAISGRARIMALTSSGERPCTLAVMR